MGRTADPRDGGGEGGGRRGARPGPARAPGVRLLHAPGIVSEKIHLLAAEIRRGPGPDEFDAPQEGDGSPLEEGATLRWRVLDEAISACESGEIEDAKSELAFRRLHHRLGR